MISEQTAMPPATESSNAPVAAHRRVVAEDRYPDPHSPRDARHSYVREGRGAAACRSLRDGGASPRAQKS